MPVVLGAFALAAAGMAGIPLFAGFVSKYYLLIGGIEMGAAFTPVGYYLAGALLVSGVLNVAYFWPVVYTAFFEAEDEHDAKPLVDYRPGGENRSTLTATDGGRPIDDADDGDEPDDDIDADTDESDDDVDADDLRPDFSGSSGERRDYSEPAPLVDGEYAVDKYPSDHVDDDETHDGHDDHDADDSHDVHDDHDGHDDHDHHGGPPPGGWRRLTAGDAFRGKETTWFMLGPILAAVTGAILVGIVPYEVLFLDLIEVIVEGVLEDTEVAR